MSLIVCSGAVCTCNFGLTPSALSVMPENKCMAGAPAATVADCVAGKNIMPFGLCTTMSNPAVAAATAAALGVLTPQPCMPVMVGMWMPGSANVLLGGKPALTGDSTAMCAYGGSIKIVSAGQTKTCTG